VFIIDFIVGFRFILRVNFGEIFRRIYLSSIPAISLALKLLAKAAIPNGKGEIHRRGLFVY